MDIEIDEHIDKNELRRIHKKLRNKQRRNILLNIITILLTLGAIIWVVTYFIKYYEYEITNDATVEQYISPVNSRISGYISKVYFTDHEFVNEGDTLVLIDDREYKIKLMDAEAALKDAEASLSVLHSSINTSVVNVSVSEANIQESKARLWKSEHDLKRYENLLAADAVSKQQYEQVRTEYEATKAHYNALLKQQESLKSLSEENHKKTASIEATIARKEADIALAKLNLSYTVIRAPYSGYVGRRALEEGQLIQAGQTITNLVRNDGKWVIANYKEKQIGNIFIGQEVRIKVDAIKNKVFKGKVTAISEATGSKYSLLPTDNAAGNFVKIQQRIPVRIDFVDLPEEYMSKLRAGMMVETEAVLK